MDHSKVTTAFELPGHKIEENLGLVRGITVRSRNLVMNLAGAIQSLFGGNISIYTHLCETARQEAYNIMIKHADGMKANAIIGVRYDATELAGGITEVLAYGTAVRVKKSRG